MNSNQMQIPALKPLSSYQWRTASTPEGTWHTSPTAIDALLDMLCMELAVSKRRLIEDLELAHASVSRCRSGQYQVIPENWLLRMYEYSGVPVPELRTIAKMPIPERHPRARNGDN